MNPVILLFMNSSMSLKERFFAWIVYLFYRVYYSTLRIRHENLWWENPNLDKNRPLILAHWHEDDIAMIGRYAMTGFYVIVSQSRDGNLLAYVMSKLGCRPLRGSSSRGGARVLLKTIRVLRKTKAVCAITIDGPRGPRHVAKTGIVKLAQKTNAQIITLNAAAQRRFVFRRSWSQTYMPLPFTKVYHYIDQMPLEVPEKLSEDDESRIISVIESRLKDNHRLLYERFEKPKNGLMRKRMR
jgi:lysophospholipid acyltransferase (LPLAT)-like uncharacterized protein